MSNLKFNNLVSVCRSWQRMQLHPDQGWIKACCLAQEELFEVAQEALKCQLEIKVFSHWQDRTLRILFLRKPNWLHSV